MAVAVVQSTSNKRTTGGTTVVGTFGAATTTGNILVAFCTGWDNFTGVSGGGVTTWSRVGSSFVGDTNHNDCDVFIGTVGATPATTVTGTQASSVGFGTIHVIELSGAQQSVDVTTAFANDANSASDSKSHTTTVNGDIILSFMCVSQGAGTATVPTGYTRAGTLQTSAGSGLADMAYLIQTTAGASTMNWSGLGGTAWPALGASSIKVSGGTNATVNHVIGDNALSAVAPTLQLSQNVAGVVGNMQLAGTAPTPVAGTQVQHVIGDMQLAGVAPTLSISTSVTSVIGNMALSATAPSVTTTGNGVYGTLYSVGKGVSESNRPIVRTQAGRVYIFCAEDRPFQGDTSEETVNFMRAYKGDQLGIPTTFTEQDTAHRIKSSSSTLTIVTPDCRIDSNGLVHMCYQVWNSTTVSDLRYVTYDTTTDLWGTSESITLSVNTIDHSWKRSFYAASLTLDTNEKPQVIYGRGTSIYYKTRSTGSWSVETTVVSGTETNPVHVNSVTDNLGNIYAVWVNAPTAATSDIHFAQRVSNAWTNDTVVTGVLNASTFDQTPAIALDASNNPVCLYLTNTTDVMTVKTRSGGTWGSADSSGVDTHASGLYTSGNDLYLGEGHSIGTTPDIQSAYTYKLSGGSWSAEQILSQTSSQKDGSAGMRWGPWSDPNPSIIDVAYFDEDVNNTGTPHYGQVYYGAIRNINPRQLAPITNMTLSATVPTVTQGTQVQHVIGNHTLAGTAPTLSISASVSPPAGLLTLGGAPPLPPVSSPDVPLRTLVRVGI